LGLGLFVTVVVYTGLFLWSTVKTVYDDHHDSVGRWQSIVDEKNRLKTMLQQRDEYIKELEGKRCTVCASYPKSSAKEPQPRTLSDLQMTVLRRDLKAGAGLKVRINALGGKADTIAFADELRQAFRGWDVGGGNVGNHPGDPNEAQDLEFVIPHPEDRSVQIAVYAFEHAQIIYGKNVSPYAYSGPISLGEPPALTINVRDR